MDEKMRRVALGAVARHEVFRDLTDTDRRWVDGNSEPLPRDLWQLLGDLEAEGLVTRPERQPGDRRDLYWDLADKALEG